MRAVSARYRSLGVTRWEDGRQHALPQDYADMLGWQKLADKTYRAYQALPAATRARTLIVCANYGQAGAINYYNRHRRTASTAVICSGGRRSYRLRNTSYLLTMSLIGYP